MSAAAARQVDAEPAPAAARSRTETLDVPWLQQPGADKRIAAEWHARLKETR